MDKSSKKNLIGQPIFKQILNLMPKAVVDKVVFKHQSDRYYKSFSTWDELITLLFGIFERCDSAREVCDGMATMSGKLNYLGMDCAPAKSTFNMLTDVHADCAKFVKMSEAKMHDKKFLQYIHCLTAGCMIVFDKAYNFYWQFAKWTQKGIFFVCRMKDNAKYEVVETLFEQTLSEVQAGVMKVEHIHLSYKEDKKQKTLCLRKVTYRDEKGRIFQFITNNWEITAEEVALIYKYRWSIELVFKKLKQNFQLHFFYSESENGIKTQV